MVDRLNFYSFAEGNPVTNLDFGEMATKGNQSLKKAHRKRPPNASTQLKNARHARQTKKQNIKDWARQDQGKGPTREAQHLIPWAVGADFGLSDKLLNEDYRNGMMLPAGRGKYIGQKANSKPKLAHIRKAISHPTYNNFAKRVIEKNLDKKAKLSEETA